MLHKHLVKDKARTNTVQEEETVVIGVDVEDKDVAGRVKIIRILKAEAGLNRLTGV